MISGNLGTTPTDEVGSTLRAPPELAIRVKIPWHKGSESYANRRKELTAVKVFTTR
jgi:hypothetical protein